MDFNPEELHYPAPWYDQVLMILLLILFALAVTQAIAVMKALKGHNAKQLGSLMKPFPPPSMVVVLAIVLSLWSLHSTRAHLYELAKKSIGKGADAYWVWRMFADSAVIHWATLACACTYLLLSALRIRLKQLEPAEKT